MNKRFSTLMAAALLAGSSVYAADGNLVKVQPTQWLDGTYVLATAKGDSIVSFTEGVKDSWENVVLKKATPKDATASEFVTIKKTGNNYELSYQGRVVYVYSDNVAYTAAGKQNMSAIITAADSTIAFKTLNTTTGGVTGAQANMFLTSDGTKIVGISGKAPLSGAKFALYAVPADAPAGTSKVDLAENAKQTFLLVIDNKYVGANIETRVVTAGEGISLSDTKPTDETNFVWIAEGSAYKNLATGKYLTVESAGKVRLSNDPVAISYNGNALVAETSVAGSAVTVQSSTPLPANLGANWSDKQIEIKNDNGKITPASTDIVLYANAGAAISWEYDETSESYEYGAGIYNANDAKPFIFSIQKVAAANNTYKVYLMQNGKHVVVGNQWVELDVQADEDSWELPTNATVVLKAGNQYVQFNGSTLTAVPRNQATQFGLGQLQLAYMQANNLIWRNGDYFTMKITYKNDKNKDVDLTGEFKGNLRPVKSVRYNAGEAEYVDAQAETDFMLVNEEGNIIVVDTEKPLHTGSQKYGFALETITPKEYQTAINEGKNTYLTTFRMSYLPGTDQKDVTSIKGITVSGNVNGTWYTYALGRQTDAKDATLVAALPSELIANGITIKLNDKSVVLDPATWLTKPAYYTVKVINKVEDYAIYNHFEKVLGLDEDGSVAFVDAENIDLTKPEGQFAIDQNYKFTNRENGAVLSNLFFGDLYKINATTFAHVTSSGTDTLKIEAITDYKSEDGFKRYTAEQLNANTYNVSMKLLNDTYLNIIENHNDKHRIGLDEEAATEWRIEMPTVKLLDATNDFIRMVPDTVTVTTNISYYVDGKGWKTTTATDAEDDYYKPETALKICTYVLKNTDNGEYLRGKDWNESVGNAYYVCDETKKQATRVAFKEVGEETVNLVPVNSKYQSGAGSWSYLPLWNTNLSYNEGNNYDFYAGTLCLTNQKIIGGTTSLTGVLKDVALYEAVSNDLFVIKEAAAPTYKKLDQDAKIILSRVNNTDEVIYEKGEFAGISNRVAYKDITPTLYVDTAYVEREGNFAYQYLLGVNITRFDETEDCGNPNHEHPRTVYTEGRFLINMADSAIANKDVHNNKFEYDGEYKLAFVKGIHQNDTLYFTNEAGEIVSKMAVGEEGHNLAKFAFKMVDEAANEFVIETGLGYETKYNWVMDHNEYGWKKVSSTSSVTPGYLRWVNGNLVVTSDIDKAEHFTMEASDKDATANDAIATSEVSVIAGNGFVTVKGAEGKNVVITNVLGQQIANTVVTSSEATIAAPAGMVVVSVEGEAAVKAIVK